MGTLYIDRRGTRLELAHKALTILEPEARPRSVPLSLIDRLIVIGHVELSSGVLTTLAESGVSLVFMPSRGQRRSAFLRSEGHGDAVRRLGQYRLVALAAECASLGGQVRNGVHAPQSRISGCPKAFGILRARLAYLRAQPDFRSWRFPALTSSPP